MSGLCIASFVLAAQGFLLVLAGRTSLSQNLTLPAGAIDHGATSRYSCCFLSFRVSLRLLISSGQSAAFYFPPFWFLGIYECLLTGHETLPVFTALARIGLLATAAMMVLAAVSYPLAYRARMRNVVEGSGARSPRVGLPGRSLCS